MGMDAQKDLGDGNNGLWATDTNADGIIDACDRNVAWNERGLGGYHGSDVDMDGQVGLSDRDLTWLNRNLMETVAIVK